MLLYIHNFKKTKEENKNNEFREKKHFILQIVFAEMALSHFRKLYEINYLKDSNLCRLEAKKKTIKKKTIRNSVVCCGYRYYLCRTSEQICQKMYHFDIWIVLWASQVALVVKNPLPMQEM